MDWMPKGEPESSFRISERTVISLHVVVLLLGFVVWNVRLGDKVEQLFQERIDREVQKRKADKAHANYEQRLYRLEERLRLNHPRADEE